MEVSRIHKIYVLVVVALGVLAIEWIGLGFGSALWLFALYAAFLVYLHHEGRPLNKFGLVLSLAPLLLALANALGFLMLEPVFWLSMPLMMIAAGYVALGTARHDYGEPEFLVDVVGGLFYLPFGNLDKLYRSIGAMFASKSGEPSRRKAVLAGILLAIPVLAIALWLLSGADLVFGHVLKTAYDNLFEHFGDSLGKLIFGVALGTLLFSTLVGFFHKWPELESRPRRSLARETILIVLIPLVLLYVLFVGAQVYQLVLFQSSVPAYAEYGAYARAGFFQLVCAAALNLLILLGSLRSSDEAFRATRLWKWLSRALCGLTLLLLVCSTIRVCGYISEYGLTELRINSVWSIVLMVIALALVTGKLLREQFRLFPALLALAMFGTTGFAYVGSDALIARYNVEAYLGGHTMSMDLGVIDSELGDDAMPAVVYLYQALEERGDDQALKLREQARKLLLDASEQARALRWQDQTLITCLLPAQVERAIFPQ